MNAKNVTSRQIAMAFTGSFLGAGFVSGQELTQFFAAFGSFGLLGMILAVLMFFMLGSFVMKIAKRTSIIEFDKIIVPKENPLLRGIFGGVFIFFLFGVVVVMVAGAGALLNQLFGIPTILGNALMATFLGVVALWEAKGVLTVFSITVPLLILVAMITGVLSFFYFEGSDIVPRPFSEENPLLGNWLFSTLAFVSYNMMAAISILVPISPEVKEEKTIHKGIFQGSIQLIIVFACILFPLIIHESMLRGTELPMLTLAEEVHPGLGIVYAILLFCGMFGSALSCLFGVTVRIKKVYQFKGSILTLSLVSLAFLGSIAGFKKLIAILFPICGYIGFFAMIGITTHYFSLQRKMNIDKRVSVK
ncbi:MAG: hypothetical protein GX958_00960 [Desulfitobacterium sp.]|nr:hypothetical protein [Desulfitobacterium sp.]